MSTNPTLEHAEFDLHFYAEQYAKGERSGGLEAAALEYARASGWTPPMVGVDIPSAARDLQPFTHVIEAIGDDLAVGATAAATRNAGQYVPYDVPDDARWNGARWTWTEERT